MRFSPTGRACALAFITAFTTLFTQVLVHRMVSAKLLNNYAFLVISLTMLGFALSGVILSFFLRRSPEGLGGATPLRPPPPTHRPGGGPLACFRPAATPPRGAPRPPF